MRPHADPEEDRATVLTPPVTPRAAWRIAAMRVLPGYRMEVRFNDGTEGEVDLSALIHSAEAGVFACLRDEALFRKARVQMGAVTWPGDLDLAPDAMYAAIKRDGTWVVS